MSVNISIKFNFYNFRDSINMYIMNTYINFVGTISFRKKRLRILCTLYILNKFNGKFYIFLNSVIEIIYK